MLEPLSAETTVFDALDTAYEAGTSLILTLSSPEFCGCEGQVIGVMPWADLVNVLFTEEQVEEMWERYGEEVDQ